MNLKTLNLNPANTTHSTIKPPPNKRQRTTFSLMKIKREIKKKIPLSEFTVNEDNIIYQQICQNGILNNQLVQLMKEEEIVMYLCKTIVKLNQEFYGGDTILNSQDSTHTYLFEDLLPTLFGQKHDRLLGLPHLYYELKESEMKKLNDETVEKFNANLKNRIKDIYREIQNIIYTFLKLNDLELHYDSDDERDTKFPMTIKSQFVSSNFLSCYITSLSSLCSIKIHESIDFGTFILSIKIISTVIDLVPHIWFTKINELKSFNDYIIDEDVIKLCTQLLIKLVQEICKYYPNPTLSPFAGSKFPQGVELLSKKWIEILDPSFIENNFGIDINRIFNENIPDQKNHAINDLIGYAINIHKNRMKSNELSAKKMFYSTFEPALIIYLEHGNHQFQSQSQMEIPSNNNLCLVHNVTNLKIENKKSSNMNDTNVDDGHLEMDIDKQNNNNICVLGDNNSIKPKIFNDEFKTSMINELLKKSDILPLKLKEISIEYQNKCGLIINKGTSIPIKIEVNTSKCKHFLIINIRCDPSSITFMDIWTKITGDIKSKENHVECDGFDQWVLDVMQLKGGIDRLGFKFGPTTLYSKDTKIGDILLSYPLSFDIIMKRNFEKSLVFVLELLILH